MKFPNPIKNYGIEEASENVNLRIEEIV